MVIQTMQKNTKVLELYITQDNADKKRLSCEYITLDKEGVYNDKFYAKDSNRAILITSIDSYKLSEANGIPLPKGALGENILIEGNPYHLLPGERFYIGNIELEITQNCTLCKGLSTLSPKLPKLLKNDRGVFAKVCNNQTATIHVGDTVNLPQKDNE
jgi:MOSC domain-containing protein YiiM